MNAAEFETFRKRHHHIRKRIWWSIVLIAVGVGYGVSLAASMLVGVIATLAIIAATQPVFLRWSRAAWEKRFPELADNPNVKWTRRAWF